jgi:hypothetical protein
VGVADAFFIQDSQERFIATGFSRGPWDPRMQHGGPPSALIGTELEAFEPFEGQQMARLTYEILRPVPVGPVRLQKRVSRPGKKVSMVEAVLTDDDGQELMLARGWRILPTPDEVAVETSQPPETRPEDGQELRLVPDAEEIFEAGCEVRFVSSNWADPGPGAAWFRLRIPLVEGREIAPLARILVAADCGNGISAPFDFERYIYVNPDLSVAISSLPEGDWVHLDASTRVAPGGVSVSLGTLSDQRRKLASSAQTLFVASR